MSTASTFEDLVERMVQAHDDDAYAEAERALGILIEKERIGRRVEFDTKVSKQCIPELLRRMHGDLDDERLQQRYSKVLGSLSWRCFEIIPAMLSFILEHPEDPSAARLGFQLTRDELTDDYYGLEYIDNISSIVVDSMIRHESDPVVQEYAMSCMREYLDKYDEEELESHAPRVFLQAMRNHPDDSNVQVAACKALLFSNEVIVIREEWPPVTILQAMTNFAHCANVQISACGLLGIFLDFDDEREVRATLIGQDYVHAILRVMQNHCDNGLVQEAALRVLRAMKDESSNLIHIIQGGGVDLVVRASRLYNCFYNGMTILDRLFESSPHARRIAIEGGAIPILIELLQSTDARARSAAWGSRQLEICGVLNRLFIENTDNTVCLRIATKGGIEAIVDTIVNDVGRPKPLRRHELKDDDILAHLAMFASVDGMLPLHYVAAWRNASNVGSSRDGQIAVVEHLLKVYPEAATVRDGSARLPLHAAIEANAPLSVSARLSVFPSVGGMPPLHYAAAWRNDSCRQSQLDLVEHLLEEYPEAATIRDGTGRLPLHAAIEANAPLSVLEALLRVNPATGEAVFRRKGDVMVNFPPALMAAANDCDLESIFALLRYVPTLTKRQCSSVNRKRKLPNDSVAPGVTPMASTIGMHNNDGPVAWPPLASSPACFNAVAADLGVGVDRLKFVDVIGIDDASLELLPLCHALVLVYPSPSACEKHLRSFPVMDGIDASGIYHCRQLVGGTCGTIAMLHALANCGIYSPQENTLLWRLTKTHDGVGDDRSRRLLDSAELRAAHDRCSAATAVKPGVRGKRQGRHFVTFTQLNSSLVMLDGRREGPVKISDGVDATGGFLRTAAAFIQKLMAVAGDDANLFSLLALVETNICPK
jgi:ubiquitin carboxyl-terminal hydrolase L3